MPTPGTRSAPQRALAVDDLAVSMLAEVKRKLSNICLFPKTLLWPLGWVGWSFRDNAWAQAPLGVHIDLCPCSPSYGPPKNPQIAVFLRALWCAFRKLHFLFESPLPCFRFRGPMLGHDLATWHVSALTPPGKSSRSRGSNMDARWPMEQSGGNFSPHPNSGKRAWSGWSQQPSSKPRHHTRRTQATALHHSAAAAK